jgi:hypothetical protein
MSTNKINLNFSRKDYSENFQEILQSIPKDEPVFFLRGQDKAAPIALEQWANENERIGGDPILSQETRKHADLMRKYQQTHKAKVADASTGQTSSKDKKY